MNWIDITYYSANGIAAILGTLVGLMKEDIIPLQVSKAHTFNITKRHIVVSLISCIVASVVLSLIRDDIAETKLEAKEISHRKEDLARDELKFKQIAELEAQHSKEIEQAILSTKESNKQDLKDNTENMLSAFARQSLKNDKAHKRTQQKLDSAEKIPASFSLIKQPHNVYRVSISNDTIYSTIKFENSGDLSAYYATIRFYLVLLMNNRYYKLSMGYPSTIYDNVISGRTQKGFKLFYVIDKSIKIDSDAVFYGIINGKYYGDDKKITPHNIDLVCTGDKTKRL